MYKYRISLMDSDSWSGQSFWTEDFDTPEEAQARITEVNVKNVSPIAPDYYVKAFTDIKVVEELTS